MVSTIKSMEAINEDDALTLRELIEAIWKGKALVMTVTAICGIAAALLAWVTPKQYVAYTLVSPVSGGSAGGQLGGLGALASQFGGLASMAGLSLTADTKKWESLAVLESADLTEKYIAKNNLLPVLFEEEWDQGKQGWKVQGEDMPTLWKANELFTQEVRSVVMNGKTGLVTLGIAWKDPQTAARWANGLVALTNQYMREKAITESERNIAYLKEQAAKTDVVGIRETIYKVLETEVNKSMMARGSEEYALRVIDPAQPPERPERPRPLFWIVGGLMAGMALSMAILFGRVAWRRN
jgi:capsular polysaccharide biosynthesis protein